MSCCVVDYHSMTSSSPPYLKRSVMVFYTLPNYLSAGAKHLLTRMLVVNPLNRITIHEIMEDEWFKQDMPDYLLPPDLSKTRIARLTLTKMLSVHYR